MTQAQISLKRNVLLTNRKDFNCKGCPTYPQNLVNL